MPQMLASPRYMLSWALYRNRFGESRVLSLGDSLLIGRSPQADLRIPDQAVSRRHCLLLGLGDVPAGDRCWVLVDLGSRNGTYLNGQRINRPHSLRVGDRVQFGRIHELLLINKPGQTV
jgi:pSer/pThr/pTyr-binding forkhead associated (FHA) protein